MEYCFITINLQSTYNQLAIINDLRKNDVYGLLRQFYHGFFSRRGLMDSYPDIIGK